MAFTWPSLCLWVVILYPVFVSLNLKTYFFCKTEVFTSSSWRSSVSDLLRTASTLGSSEHDDDCDVIY